MIEAARRARRPDRQSRDARFAQANAGTPRLQPQTLGGRPERASDQARRRRALHWKQQRVGLSALSVRTARTFL